MQEGELIMGFAADTLLGIRVWTLATAAATAEPRSS